MLWRTVPGRWFCILCLSAWRLYITVCSSAVAVFAKQPAEYTYDEFNNLTPGQQMAFQKYLGEEAFDAWLNANLPQ